MRAALWRTEDLEADGGAERIFLLYYSRHPDEFRQALCQGALLEECRQALQKAKRFWVLPSGARTSSRRRWASWTI